MRPWQPGLGVEPACPTVWVILQAWWEQQGLRCLGHPLVGLVLQPTSTGEGGWTVALLLSCMWWGPCGSVWEGMMGA